VNPKPGSRVTPRVDIPGYGQLPAIREGQEGRVVRLVHSTVEGEPFGDGRDGEECKTIAHVRWDGMAAIYPIAPSLLRVLDPIDQPS
jgi:hypothetical protein